MIRVAAYLSLVMSRTILTWMTPSIDPTSSVTWENRSCDVWQVTAAAMLAEPVIAATQLT